MLPQPRLRVAAGLKPAQWASWQRFSFFCCVIYAKGPSTYVWLRTSVSARGLLTCFPRFDSRVSHWTLPAIQLLQGCRSVTSHFTRRALQVTHANFARFRGGSDMLAEA